MAAFPYRHGRDATVQPRSMPETVQIWRTLAGGTHFAEFFQDSSHRMGIADYSARGKDGSKALTMIRCKGSLCFSTMGDAQEPLS